MLQENSLAKQIRHLTIILSEFINVYTVNKKQQWNIS